MSAEDKYDGPTGEVKDDSYATGESEIPVQSDDAPVEDPINPDNADSDEMLGKPIVTSFLKNDD
jgi:hypothetical protein